MLLTIQPATGASVIATLDPYGYWASCVHAVLPSDGIVMVAAVVPIVNAQDEPAGAPALQTFNITGGAGALVKVTTLAPATAENDAVPVARFAPAIALSFNAM